MTEALDPAVVARQVTFAVSLLALVIGHQVGDHVLQTDHQAAAKSTAGWSGARAMLGHLVNYHLTVAVVLVGTAYPLQLPLSPVGVAAGLGFSAVTHALLDRRWPVRLVLRGTGSPAFAEQASPVCGMYVADQALHWLSLLGSALLIACL